MWKSGHRCSRVKYFWEHEWFFYVHKGRLHVKKCTLSEHKSTFCLQKCTVCTLVYFFVHQLISNPYPVCEWPWPCPWAWAWPGLSGTVRRPLFSSIFGSTFSIDGFSISACRFSISHFSSFWQGSWSIEEMWCRPVLTHFYGILS